MPEKRCGVACCANREPQTTERGISEGAQGKSQSPDGSEDYCLSISWSETEPQTTDAMRSGWLACASSFEGRRFAGQPLPERRKEEAFWKNAMHERITHNL